MASDALNGTGDRYAVAIASGSTRHVWRRPHTSESELMGACKSRFTEKQVSTRSEAGQYEGPEAFIMGVPRHRARG